jgi:hypothetical protein
MPSKLNAERAKVYCRTDHDAIVLRIGALGTNPPVQVMHNPACDGVAVMASRALRHTSLGV